MRATRFSTVVFLAAAAALSAAAANHPVRAQDALPRATPESRKRLEERKAALYARKRHDETGHVRLGPPSPGEWLHSFDEAGQDETDYARELTNKRTPERATLTVTELGELEPRAAAVQSAVTAYLHAFFQLPVERSEPLGLPRRYYVAERKQYDGDALLRLVRGSATDGSLATVGLLDQDLFASGLNFVFGLGSEEKRAGVYSFARLDPGERADHRDASYLRRALRLVSHEVGHVLGLAHCVYYACLMNGAGSLGESDRVPLHLCPVCVAKLASNVGFDALVREKELAAFFGREELEAEATWSAARVARLEGAKRRE